MSNVRVTGVVLAVLIARILLAGSLILCGQYALAVGLILLTEAVCVAAALKARPHSPRPDPV